MFFALAPHTTLCGKFIVARIASRVQMEALKTIIDTARPMPVPIDFVCKQIGLHADMPLDQRKKFLKDRGCVFAAKDATLIDSKLSRVCEPAEDAASAEADSKGVTHSIV